MSSKTEPFINQYGIDFRYEVRINLWWREQIGDDATLKFDSDDLVRWYLAMERHGPVEVRAMLNERLGNRPLRHLQTLGRAPHPPVWLVERWLESHSEKVHTAHYWWAAFGTVFLLAMVASWLARVGNLQPMNHNLIMNPPPGLTPPPPNSIAGAPTYNVAPLQQVAAPPPTMPHSIGIGSSGSAGTPSSASSSTGH